MHCIHLLVLSVKEKQHDLFQTYYKLTPVSHMRGCFLNRRIITVTVSSWTTVHKWGQIHKIAYVTYSRLPVTCARQPLGKASYLFHFHIQFLSTILVILIWHNWKCLVWIWRFLPFWHIVTPHYFGMKMNLELLYLFALCSSPGLIKNLINGAASVACLRGTSYCILGHV